MNMGMMMNKEMAMIILLVLVFCIVQSSESSSPTPLFKVGAAVEYELSGYKMEGKISSLPDKDGNVYVRTVLKDTAYFSELKFHQEELKSSGKSDSAP